MIDLDALLARLKMVMDTHPDDGGQVLLADGVEDCYEAITRLRADLATVWCERCEFAKRIDEADADLAQRTAERDALAAEVAALKAEEMLSATARAENAALKEGR